MRAFAGLLIGAMMVAASACATVPPTPPSVNVTGNWVGTWWTYDGAGGSGTVNGNFQQDGATLLGNFEVTGPVVNRTLVSGTVVGNEVRLSAPSPGTLVVAGNEMSGVVYGLSPTKVTLRRQP